MTISSILDRFDRWVDILLYDRGGWWLKKSLPPGSIPDYVVTYNMMVTR